MEQSAKNIILDLASKQRQVVYGQQSINQQLPVHLRRETEDFDILAVHPKKSAYELAEKLNKRFGEGNFTVERAKYNKTWKVKSKDGKTVADYTKVLGRKPKSKLILGVHYADTDYSKRKINKILKDESSSYRHDKDRDTLNRLKEGDVELW